MTKLEQLIEEKLLVVKWLEHGNQAMRHFKERNSIGQYQARMYKETIKWVKELTSKYKRLNCEIDARIRKIKDGE